MDQVLSLQDFAGRPNSSFKGRTAYRRSRSRRGSTHRMTIQQIIVRNPDSGETHLRHKFLMMRYKQMIHCNWCGGLGDAKVVQVHCRKGVDLYMMYGRVFGSVGIAPTPKHPLSNCLLQHFASSTTFNSLKNGLCCFIDHCLLYFEDTSLMKVVQRKKLCNNMCGCGGVRLVG